MGMITVLISGEMKVGLFREILKNEMLYFITGAVLVAGIMFKFSVTEIRRGISSLSKRVPMPVLLFLVITILGLISSVITAIIAALVLVEVANALPIGHQEKIKLVVITCFSIGLGAALTPIGEP
jgi:predicted cation transporter